jgi:hypothetical protein
MISFSCGLGCLSGVTEGCVNEWERRQADSQKALALVNVLTTENRRRAMHELSPCDPGPAPPPQLVPTLAGGKRTRFAKYKWERATSPAKVEISRESVCQVTNRILL